MLIALLLQALLSTNPPAGEVVEFEGPPELFAPMLEAARKAAADQRIVLKGAVQANRCGDGIIQAGIAPGSVYRGEPVLSHPPVHVPGAYADEGVYAAVVRFGPDGCMEPVPISLPYAKPADAQPRRR